MRIELNKKKIKSIEALILNAKEDRANEKRIVIRSQKAREAFFMSVLGLPEEGGWDTIFEIAISNKYTVSKLYLNIDEVYGGSIENFNEEEFSLRYEPQKEDYFSCDHVVLKSDDAKELFFDEWIGIDDGPGDTKMYQLVDEIDIKEANGEIR